LVINNSAAIYRDFTEEEVRSSKLVRTVKESLSHTQQRELFHDVPKRTDVPSWFYNYRRVFRRSGLKACDFLGNGTYPADPQTGDPCVPLQNDYYCMLGEKTCASNVVPKSLTHPQRRCECDVSEGIFTCEEDWPTCFESSGTITECPSQIPYPAPEETSAGFLQCFYEFGTNEACCDGSFQPNAFCYGVADSKFNCGAIRDPCHDIDCPVLDDPAEDVPGCPATPPEVGSSCSVTESCEFGEPRMCPADPCDDSPDAELVERGPELTCECTDGEWFCFGTECGEVGCEPSDFGFDFCPESVPIEGIGCQLEGPCEYDEVCCDSGDCINTTIVACENGAFAPPLAANFVCPGPDDCPLSLPTEGDSCNEIFDEFNPCRYDPGFDCCGTTVYGDSCTCVDGGWTCSGPPACESPCPAEPQCPPEGAVVTTCSGDISCEFGTKFCEDDPCSADPQLVASGSEFDCECSAGEWICFGTGCGVVACPPPELPPPELDLTEAPTGAPVTASPTIPDATLFPTTSPTAAPTGTPTGSPTGAPTGAPSASPTSSPTAAPVTAEPTMPDATPSPTSSPSPEPTGSPTTQPTGAPTGSPTGSPVVAPTGAPTDLPTGSPVTAPTGAPTDPPSVSPSVSATDPPTASPVETTQTTPVPTAGQPSGAVCGGIAGLVCAEGLSCEDDPSDSCDPAAGGADCIGVCVDPNEPEVVTDAPTESPGSPEEDFTATPAGFNCESLDDGYQVRWQVDGDSLNIELLGVIFPNQYMGFGRSGQDNVTFMLMSDVTVADISEEGDVRARDYYLFLRNACNDAGFGVCEDSVAGLGNDVSGVSGIRRSDDVALIRYTRPLAPSDAVTDFENTTPISVAPGVLTYVAWAIGPIDTNGQPLFHSRFPPGNVAFEFGREPLDNCTALDLDTFPQ